MAQELRLYFHCWGLGSVSGWGAKIPQATWHGQKKRLALKINKFLNWIFQLPSQLFYKD